MCFLNEAEWSASVISEAVLTATKDEGLRCRECRRRIMAGETYQYVYQQEHECCYNCDAEPCECEDAKPDYGHTFEYWCCEGCLKFLQAIEATELAEGCGRHESRPCYGDMIEEIGSNCRKPRDSRKYWLTALRMFPELKTSGYLAMLWRRCFCYA